MTATNDLLCLIQALQREFGRTAPLEGVIQALVAQDLEQQMTVRRKIETRQGAR